MIRGINRQVVEINQPESAYFEKVLFFVDPDYYGMSERTLQSRANEMLEKSSAKPPKTKKNRKIIVCEIIRTAIALAAGAAISASAIIFFFSS